MKIMLRKLFISGVVATALFGFSVNAKEPSVSDKYTIAYIKANLKVNSTTQAQVEDRFGNPADRDVDLVSGIETETWTYKRFEEGAQGAVTKSKRLFRNVTNVLPIGAIRRAMGEVDDTAVGVENKVAGVTRLGGETKEIRFITVKFRDGVVDSYDVSK